MEPPFIFDNLIYHTQKLSSNLDIVNIEQFETWYL